jgi:hypothetical protein
MIAEISPLLYYDPYALIQLLYKHTEQQLTPEIGPFPCNHLMPVI